MSSLPSGPPPSVSFYHKDLVEQYFAHVRVGDRVAFRIDGEITSVSRDSVTVEIISLMRGSKKMTFAESAESATQEVNRVALRTEPSAG